MPDSETSDARLLEQWLKNRSDAAFLQLAQRYHGLVRAAALRSCDDDTLADEATQLTFISFARKAAALSSRTSIAGWLYITAVMNARNLAKKHRREEAKRRQYTLHMETDSPEFPADAWLRMRPMLDSAMAALSTQDRETLLMRFYRSQSVREIAALWGIAVPAAQKRLDRAVQRMRRELARRGCVVGASLPAILHGGLAADACTTVPSLSLVVSRALASAAGTTSPLLPLLGILIMTKKTAIFAAAAAVLGVVAIYSTIRTHQERANQDSISATANLSPGSSSPQPQVVGEGVLQKSKTRPEREFPALIAQYGESRVALSKNITVKIVGMIEVMTDLMSVGVKGGNSPGLPAKLQGLGADLALTDDQEEKFRSLYQAYLDQRIASAQANVAKLKQDPEIIMRSLLIGDARAMGRLSDQEYHNAVGKELNILSQMKQSFGQTAGDPLDDESFTGSFTRILSSGQTAKFASANQARLAAKGEDAAKTAEPGEEPPQSLEDTEKRIAGVCQMLDGMKSMIGGAQGLQSGGGK
jgi:RNA polymerase sigma factor (sigma-70 family)